MSYPQSVKDRAHEIDPEAFVSYSGKPREFKQAMDARRTAALEKASEEIPFCDICGYEFCECEEYE